MLWAVLELEHLVSFACFGGTCSVLVAGDGLLGPAPEAVASAQTMLLEWHERFSRFLPTSELSQLNADPRVVVPVSPLMAELASAVIDAARATDGLVDGTLVDALERAGYADHFDWQPLHLEEALSAAPERAPAQHDPLASWAQIEVDAEAGIVTRPPGVRIDSGGLVKGLLADRLANLLEEYDAYVVNCCGDLRVGGRMAVAREVEIEDPFDVDWALHTYAFAERAVATSGIARRSWLGPDGRPAHHLLDPSTGRPVFSGVVQVTALAPTALEAEIRSKRALLAGPERLAEHLPGGGLAVLDDGRCVLVAEPRLAPAIRITQTTEGVAVRGSGIERGPQ